VTGEGKPLGTLDGGPGDPSSCGLMASAVNVGTREAARGRKPSSDSSIKVESRRVSSILAPKEDSGRKNATMEWGRPAPKPRSRLTLLGPFQGSLLKKANRATLQLCSRKGVTRWEEK